MAFPSFCCWLLVLGPRAVPVQEAGEEDAGPSQLAQQAAPAEVLTGIAERSVSLNLQVQGQESDLRRGAPRQQGSRRLFAAGQTCCASGSSVLCRNGCSCQLCTLVQHCDAGYDAAGH